MSNHNFIKRAVTVGLITGAAAFPAAAQAQYAEDGGGGVATAQVPVTGPQHGLGQLQSDVQQWFATHGRFPSPSSSPTATATPAEGFQWGDAGIGAAGAVVLLGAAAAGSTVTRRRRRPALS
jgi:hypothetical protein